MKRLISTLAVTAALSLGLWTLAVTFTPIASNFTDGDPVSAAAFNALFDAIEANFSAAKTAIDANEAAVATNAADIATNSSDIADLQNDVDAVAGLATPPAARVIPTTDQNVNNNQLTTVVWEFEDFDSADMHDNAVNNTRITVPEDGIYHISSQVNWIATASGGRLIGIYLNGSTFPSITQSSEGPDLSSNASGVLALDADDFIEVKVFQSSGSAADVSSTAQSQFSVVKLGDLP